VVLAGRLFEFTPGHAWWATKPQAEWPPAVRKLLLGDGGAASGGGEGGGAASRWDSRYGDRAQELVLIGCGMDQAAVRGALEGALLSDAEFALGPDEWDGWDDPFDFFEYEDDGGSGEGEGEGGSEHVHSDACAHGHGHGYGHDGGATITRRVVTKDGRVEVVEAAAAAPAVAADGHGHLAGGAGAPAT
jgi:hypothetical protein